jgi:transcriptional regulator with XRE-family HTH domain
VAGGRQGAPGFDPSRLRAAREAAHLSQSALADAAHVHISSIREWEAGRQIPRLDTVATLARALHITPADLLHQPPDGPTRTLQQLRAAAGKSQQHIADAAGLLRTTYSAIERGETATLSYTDVQGLAHALNITPEQLLAAHTASRSAYLGQDPHPHGNGRTHTDS